MRILFVGYAIDESDKNASGLSVAGNKMQLGIIKGLSQHSDVDISAITLYPVACYPRDKRIRIKKEIISVCPGVKSIKIPFFNFPVIKQLSEMNSVRRCLKNEIKKYDVVLSFNVFPQIGIPLLHFNKKRKYKIASILADLPIDDNKKNRKWPSKLLRCFFDKATLNCIKKLDNFIVLNPNTINDFTRNKNNIVIEGGIYDENLERQTINYRKTKEKHILYTGALTEYSGVLNLIESFNYLDDNFFLDIYGDGPLKEKIKKMILDSDRIVYHGIVSNKEALILQKKSFLLVNPRSTDDPISKYTFPSKLFEYMLSGRPVLTTRFSGFPNEYEDKMFVIDDNDPITISKKINGIAKLGTEYLDYFAMKTRDYVIANKNWYMQTSKILDFLKGIN